MSDAPEEPTGAGPNASAPPLDGQAEAPPSGHPVDTPAINAGAVAPAGDAVAPAAPIEQRTAQPGAAQAVEDNPPRAAEQSPGEATEAGAGEPGQVDRVLVSRFEPERFEPHAVIVDSAPIPASADVPPPLDPAADAPQLGRQPYVQPPPDRAEDAPRLESQPDVEPPLDRAEDAPQLEPDVQPSLGHEVDAAGPEQPTPAAGPAPAPLDVEQMRALQTEVGALRAQFGSLAETLQQVSAGVEEISRLRRHDTDLVDRLHNDVTRLRAGEVAQAITPVVLGMLKVHDQMVSLGAEQDSNSVAGLLHGQLLQSLELTAGVKPFAPTAGEPFDAKWHTGVRRVPTADQLADGTVAKTVKVGFTRADGGVVRTAEVEVHRLSA